MRLVVVGHRADDVALGVFERCQDADRRDRRLLHEDAATVLCCSLGDGVEIVDGNGAFETVRTARAARLPALVHQALDTGVLFVAGMYEIEIGRPPRFEAPAEHGFVKAAAALDVVGVNGEAGKVGGHGERVMPLRGWRNPATLTFNVEKATYAGGRAPLPRADARERLSRRTCACATRASVGAAHIRGVRCAERLDRARIL